MAYRTTPDAVKDLLGDDYGQKADGTLPDLVRHIRWANLLTTRVAACAVTRGTPLTTAELIEIELNLSAHKYTGTDTPMQSESQGGASGTKQGQTAMYLERSTYGQDALSLDSSGCLRAIAMGKGRPQAVWGGKPEGDELSYEDRNG